VKNLYFSYKKSQEPVLKDLNLSLTRGSRCLLVGANGAGKSTLLRILAGKHMHNHDQVLVLGQPAFYSTPRNLTYMGSEWRKSVSFAQIGVTVNQMLEVHKIAKDIERREFLLKLLEIDRTWCTSELSDGQLRRIQIMLGLLQPFELLLLDEITVDLDCYMRTELLEFLKQETQRGATIVYATHIFDGLEDWATHIARLSNGELTLYNPSDVIKPRPGTLISPLYLTIVEWLREDLAKLKAIKHQ